MRGARFRCTLGLILGSILALPWPMADLKAGSKRECPPLLDSTPQP
jgi:hypothetical protein